MFKNIRNTFAGLFAAMMLALVPVAIPAVASAASDPGTLTGNCAAQGSNLTLDNVGAGGCNGTQTTSDSAGGLTNLIKTIINIFSVVVGVVAVIMIIVGGFRYITSGGDSNNVSGAKNTIIYAIIGLVVVALAQFIVQFVLNKLGNGQ